MAKNDAPLSAEELNSAFLRVSIPKLPEAVSSRMLADKNVLAALRLPTEEFIRLWGLRFSRPGLFACLRSVANGADGALESSDGTLKVDEARLDEDGAVLLRAGRDVLRFVNASLLGDDLPRRQQALDRIVANGEMSPEREAMWRQAIAMGPLDDPLFLALEEELAASPEAAFREMENDIEDGSATFDVLVPLDINHYAGLLGLFPPPASLEEFQSAWFARAGMLDEIRLIRLLKLSGPLSVVSGGLVAQASERLPPEARMAVTTYLQSCPDPFSVVAAFEIACRHRADSAMRAIADSLVPRLFDRADPLIEQGGAALAATVHLTTAFTARNRTLLGWPLYARRLARFLNAGHLVRVFRGASVDPAPFNEEVGRSYLPHARLAELCDAQEAPAYQAGHLGPAFLHGLVASRASEAIALIEEAERPEAWLEAGRAAIAAATEDGTALFLFAPGPFDQFEPGWKGLNLFPTDNIEQLCARLATGEDADRSISDLINLAVMFEVPVEERPRVAASLPGFIRGQEGGQFLLGAELGLQLAARWRDEQLSDRVVDLLLERARGDGLADAAAAPRLIMLAAAASETREAWLQRAGNLAQHFSYAQRPGIPSINLMRALDLLRDMEPDLGPQIASARAFATLTFDRLPKVPTGGAALPAAEREELADAD